MAQRHKEGHDGQDFASEFDLSSKKTEFIDLKRCFKTCVTDMGKKYLDHTEDSCSSNFLISNYFKNYLMKR